MTDFQYGTMMMGIMIISGATVFGAILVFLSGKEHERHNRLLNEHRAQR